MATQEEASVVTEEDTTEEENTGPSFRYSEYDGTTSINLKAPTLIVTGL